MNVGNTAAVFAPNLLRPRVESIEQLADTVHIVNLVAFMISDPHRIFEAYAGGDDSATASARHTSCRSSVAAQGSTPQGSTPATDRGTSHYRLSSTSSADGDEPAAAEPASTESKPWYYLNDAHEQQGPVRAAPPSRVVERAQLGERSRSLRRSSGAN